MKKNISCSYLVVGGKTPEACQKPLYLENLCLEHSAMRCYACGRQAYMPCAMNRHPMCGAGGCATGHDHVCALVI